MPTALYEHRLTVMPRDIDVLGHANNLVYLRWMIDAALAHSAEQGWPSEAYHRLGSGWVVRAHQITYRVPALEGDAITVRTWIAEARGASCLRRYEIVRGGATGEELRLADGETRWAYIRFSTGTPLRIPDEVAAAFPVLER